MACEGQKICLDPGTYCPDNRYCFPECEGLGLDLRINPNNGFIPGIPNVPPVLEEIFDLECPMDEIEGVQISRGSGQSFFRTTDLIFNQRYRARLFLLQATDAGEYTITISNNTFSPFITAQRSTSVQWQAISTNLVIDVAADQTGPILIEVTTEFAQTFGSFDIRLDCEGGGGPCMGAEGCPGFNVNALCSWNVIRPIDVCGVGCGDDGTTFGDFLPGNGMYADMSSTLGDTRGWIISKALFTFDLGKQYELSYKMAGSQRSPPGPTNDSTLVKVTDGVTDHFSFDRIVHFTAPFVTFSHTFFAMGTGQISFESQNPSLPLQAGALLKEVVLRNVTDNITMFHSLF